MSKIIEIKGKLSRDKILKNEPKRENMKNSNIDFKNLTHTKQINYINKLFLDNQFSEREIIEKEIKNKLRGYKNQDNKNKNFDDRYFIKHEEVIEKLVASKLHCFYCNTNISILYNKCHDNTQWTLDRIDNDEGHNRDNVNISCLKCNIQRKDMNVERFTKSKNMRFVKIE